MNGKTRTNFMSIDLQLNFLITFQFFIAPIIIGLTLSNYMKNLNRIELVKIWL